MRMQTRVLFKKAKTLFPGGVNSPVRAFQSLEMDPLIVKKGKGSQIWDVDGNSYIDFCCSWGSLIFGHAPEFLIKNIGEQLEFGTSYGALCEGEILLAESLLKHLQIFEKCRFVSSGTEATMTAIRLARGVTGKNTIIKFAGNYHGHSDALLVKAGSGVHSLPEATSSGIPQEVIAKTICLSYNDIEGFLQYMDSSKDIAAVIVEPVAGNMGVIPATHEFMQALRLKTSEKGALLILDEVITGFRVALKGASHYYGIKPDLACYGKIIGGGFPVAALAGSSSIMDHLAPLGDVYQAGTLSGNPLAMRAGFETLIRLNPALYDSLQEKMDFFLNPIVEEIKNLGLPITINRIGSMFSFFFGTHSVSDYEGVLKADKNLFTEFFTELFEKGIYLSPSYQESCFISDAHSHTQLRYTQTVILSFLRRRFAMSKVCCEEAVL